MENKQNMAAGVNRTAIKDIRQMGVTEKPYYLQTLQR